MEKFKYYLNERPASIGTVPKDFSEYNPDDKGGRYGSITYNRELMIHEVIEYELTEVPFMAEGIRGDNNDNKRQNS